MKRRDITLGEMQDECKRRGARCIVDGECKFHSICKSMNINGYLRNIQDWDLTDPPRFTEAQMGFWGFWFSIGARFAKIGTHDSVMAIYFYKNDHASWESYMGFVVRFEGLGQLEVCNGETLDIAELLGKDGSE